jgi:general nucleoside transport system permease protein
MTDDELEREYAAEEAVEAEPHAEPGGYAPSVAERLAIYQRAGGLVAPVMTTVLAFLMGGLVVLATGHDPFKTYKAIFNGTGLNWLFPWVTGQARTDASFNLQQTLLLMTTLILTGLAVAFAFRCGLFNIGGQGQYLVGAYFAVWIGSSFAGLSTFPHVLLGVVVAAAAGAAFAAIAGVLKATVGAHEVITTIMLNWIAIWVGQWLFGRGGPLQNGQDVSVPISNDVTHTGRLPVFWGDPDLQGLHVGIFIALAMLVVFWLVLNRTTLGYEVRATGYNPEASRYGGISVRRSYILAMAISGLFAGLAGAMDELGWLFRIGVLDIQVSNIGFIGIAVALLGRNTAVGVGLAALLFAGLVQGTSTRNPQITDVFRPELAGNLTLTIIGLILLFVGSDLLVLYIWQLRKKLRLTRAAPAPAGEAA